VLGLGYSAWTLWSLGYPAQALERIHEAFAMARELTNSNSLTTALYAAATLYQYRREWHAAQERAEALITLCTEQELPGWLAWGTTLRGVALAGQGQAEEGITQIQRGLAAGGTIESDSRPLVFLAEAYGEVGQTEEGLNALAEALAMTDKSGERYYEAEIYRLKGELTLKQSRVQSLESRVEKEAEECFQKAIDIAHRQQAKSLELRAVMSLARLWQSQGRNDEARRMLAESYSWFAEGFDTADLKDAKALLEELSVKKRGGQKNSKRKTGVKVVKGGSTKKR
jgi:predicted ATPase